MSIIRGQTEKNYFSGFSMPGIAMKLFTEWVKSIGTLLKVYPSSTIKWGKKLDNGLCIYSTIYTILSFGCWVLIKSFNPPGSLWNGSVITTPKAKPSIKILSNMSELAEPIHIFGIYVCNHHT